MASAGLPDRRSAGLALGLRQRSEGWEALERHLLRQVQAAREQAADSQQVGTLPEG